ncbi:MAG TPA: deoxyribonuclease IV [Thermodesulfobacteriota bacterium]|jgi:deoxyribonuclease-4|nr:deoxyribonuclease IV [Thermodesulfobacteriota bacterium]
MRFGFHISIAGGFSKVVERADVRGCETIQFFSRNPRGWKYSPLNKKETEQFRSSIRSSTLSPVFLHMPYLPNVASFKSKFYKRSIRSIATDLHRAELLGAQYLIIHIGHRMESSEDEAIEAVSQAVNQAFERAPNAIILLMENTAGQGTEIGHNFDQIKRIIEGVHDHERMGVCLDTAHTFEAGYDLSSKDGIDRTLEKFDETIGLKRLHLLHLNDSKTPLGSRKDRHWHIGEGYIGLEGFRNLVNHPLLNHLPGIMETPRKDTVEDLKNMKVIRGLVKQK